MDRLMVNIVVIDSNYLYRKGVLSILGDSPEFQVVNEAKDSNEAVVKAGEIQPDIVLIDVFGNGSDSVESISFLRQRFPYAKFIILTSSSKEDDFIQVIRAGARGYLLKTLAPIELIESIRLVTSSDAIVSPSKAIGLFEELSKMNGTNGNSRQRLSLREKEVLRFVAHGASNKEIASKCYVSETTVKAHIRKILEKMHVRNRAEAVALAATQGLLSE
jgi:DNA-binding NarL/FixJ family response regulator